MSFGFFKTPNFTANDGIVNAENLSVHGVIHTRGKDELDHTKWLVFATHMSSQKVQGYDAPERGSLTFEAEMSGRVENLGERPGSDFRLPTRRGVNGLCQSHVKNLVSGQINYAWVYSLADVFPSGLHLTHGGQHPQRH